MSFAKTNRIVLLLLTSTLLLTVYLSGRYLNNFLQKVSGKKDASFADISVLNNNLIIKFSFAEVNRGQIQSLSNKLGLDNGFLDGISVELDQESAGMLSGFLPVRLFIYMDKQNLNLRTDKFALPMPDVSNTIYEISTGSASLKLKSGSKQDFLVEINGPYDILNFATSSGMVHISKKADGLFPIIQKLSTIYISASGKSMEGAIQFESSNF